MKVHRTVRVGFKSTGRRDSGLDAKIAVTRQTACACRRADADHACTYRRHRFDSRPVVTGRRDDGFAEQHDIINGALHRLRAFSRIGGDAETHIQYVRGFDIVRYTGDDDAGSPAHRVDDIGRVTAAFAQRAHGKNFRKMIDAGDTAVVRIGANNAGNVGTVPIAVGRIRASRKVTAPRFAGTDPRAGIAAVAVAAIAVIGGIECTVRVGADEIKSLHQASPEVSMI